MLELNRDTPLSRALVAEVEHGVVVEQENLTGHVGDALALAAGGLVITNKLMEYADAIPSPTVSAIVKGVSFFAGGIRVAASGIRTAQATMSGLRIKQYHDLSAEYTNPSTAQAAGESDQAGSERSRTERIVGFLRSHWSVKILESVIFPD